MNEATDIIVIGAGFAGLVAARDLGQRGATVVALEARDRIGGRAFYGQFPEAGRSVELGGAWFDTVWQIPLREEAERYGVEIADATPYQTTRWFTGGELRSGLPVGRWEGGELEKILFEITLAARGLATASPEELRAHDIPVSAWLQRLHPTPAVRDFIYGWTSLMSGAHPDDHPMLSTLGLIAHHGSAYAFYADLKHVFARGTSSLARAIAGDVPGEIHLNEPVRAICQTERGVRVETANRTLEGKGCVLAVPINTMARLQLDPPFTPERFHALRQGSACTMTKVWMLATGVPERMLAAGWNTPFYWLAAEQAVDDGQLVVAFALRNSVDSTDLNALEQALRVYAPEAHVIAARSHDWVKDPWACGGWRTDPPGWTTTGIPELIAAPHGRILMAGSDVAPRFGGWIAGAIESGRVAAHQMEQQLLSS
ncbi:MAG: amino acid oxidase [Thermomicrobiales bacterium]|nr:amino acid oxidase [Thermomicrobiales bacterium]